MRYVNSRYVSPPEGIWRMFSYEMHKRSHTIVRLPVHLEDLHTVYFAPGRAEERLHNANQRRTKLTEFFALNTNDVGARQYLYHEIPVHYTWNQANRTWSRRQRRKANETLARMYAVSLMDQHRFHLRLLLLHRRGPQSLRNIRMVNGIVHETYGAAAIELGLIEDDRAWHACMEESAALDTPEQLRYLFVTILAHCHPAETLRLCTSYEDCMMEDFNRRLQVVDRASAATLDAIEGLLRVHGKTLDDYGLPNPDVRLLEPEQDDQLFRVVDAAARWAQQVADMNNEQRTVFDRVMEA
ncbi:uncharacterized protein LOC111030553, partial [Myzus persicae]|uniref:uncharacterized protein LOC111030553 n=1 Tax=Myzus persicae TaxID=13164 RepID=UPI000B938EFB